MTSSSSRRDPFGMTTAAALAIVSMCACSCDLECAKVIHRENTGLVACVQGRARGAASCCRPASGSSPLAPTSPPPIARRVPRRGVHPRSVVARRLSPSPPEDPSSPEISPPRRRRLEIARGGTDAESPPDRPIRDDTGEDGARARVAGVPRRGRGGEPDRRVRALQRETDAVADGLRRRADRLDPTLAAVFRPLRRDDATNDFLMRSSRRPWVVNWAQSYACTQLRRFVSLTDANAVLGRGR